MYGPNHVEFGIYHRLEDVPQSMPGSLKVLDPIRAKTLDAAA